VGRGVALNAAAYFARTQACCLYMCETILPEQKQLWCAWHARNIPGMPPCARSSRPRDGAASSSSSHLLACEPEEDIRRQEQEDAKAKAERAKGVRPACFGVNAPTATGCMFTMSVVS
jgi:hypothetical protein